MNTKLIRDLLVGRSILLHAAKHAKSYSRFGDMKCTLWADDDYGQFKDHIGKWIKAGREDGFDVCEDERFELMECPRCSAEYSAYQAAKMMRAQAGVITGILTRIGNNLRSKG